MDEEVLLQSSPLYEHFQQLNKEEFDISTLDVTKPVVICSQAVQPTKRTVEDNIYGLPSWCQRLLNVREAEDEVVESLWLELSTSNCLSKEHRSVVEAYQEAYHSSPSSSPHGQVLRMSLHSIGCAFLWYNGTRVAKAFATITWLGHMLLPVATAIMTHQLRATRLRISTMLKTFTEVSSVLNGVHRYCEEVQLIALGNGLRRVHGESARGRLAQELASSLRKAAIVYLTNNIVKLKEDVELMLPLISHILLPHLDLSQSAECFDDFTFDSFKRKRQHLRLLMSQWIYSLALLTTDNKSKIAGYTAALQGLTTPQQLQRQLAFCKAVLDGELSSHHLERRSFENEKDEAVHSLYLHARELMNLAKMADKDLKLKTDEMLQEMMSEMDECKSCLNIISRRKKITSHRKLDVPLAEKSELCEATPLPPHTVIDQVFVTEGVDGEGGDMQVDEVCNMEMKLRREYEMALMRELKGVINELARERLKRESTLSQGASREQVARLTEELVTGRNIRALVQTQVDEGENDQRHLTDTDDTSDIEPVSYEVTEQGQRSSKVYSVSDDKQMTIEMKHLAEMVAARFALQHNSEETYGTDEDS